MIIKISCPRPCCHNKPKIEAYINEKCLEDIGGDFPSMPLNKHGEKIK